MQRHEKSRPGEGTGAATQQVGETTPIVPPKGRRNLAARAIIRSEPEPISHPAMVVLAAMATWADPYDPQPVCFKDQESIAHRAKLSPSTTRRALVELEKAGAIKRLGVVGGGRDPRTGQIKRGTVKWGLILIWDAAHTVTMTDKEPAGHAVTTTDKRPVTVTDKSPVTMTDKPNQSQSSEGATDDDDSGAPAPGIADAPPTHAPSDKVSALVAEVAERLGEPIEAAHDFVENCRQRKPNNLTSYVRTAVANRLAAADKSTEPTAGRKRPKPAVARCTECGEERELHILAWQVDPEAEPPAKLGHGVCNDCWPCFHDRQRTTWPKMAAALPPCDRCGRRFVRQTLFETVTVCPCCWDTDDPYEPVPDDVAYCLDCWTPIDPDDGDYCEPCWQASESHGREAA